MPSNPKRPAPAPTSLPKQGTAMNTSKKSGSKPGTNSGANSGTTKSQSVPGAASSGEQSWEAAEQQKTDQSSAGNAEVPAASVNRKKQKRRQKQAARLAAEQQLNNGYLSTNSLDQSRNPSYPHGHHGDTNRSYMEHVISGSDPNYADPDYEDVDQYEPVEGEDLYYTDEEGRLYAQPHVQGQFNKNGFGNQNHDPGSRRTKKKKGKKTQSNSHSVVEESSTSHSTPSASARPPPPPPPPLSNAVLRSAHKISKDRIWNTSTQEERENIKEFWLQLGEEERRSLVKVEKEAVLRKMKEQQKHSCSCTVCGRKRTAIEEELEVLYDAYYEELEQYANHNQGSLENGTPIVPPPRLYRPPLRSLDRHPHLSNIQHPPPGRVQELPDDDEDLEEEYDEDDEDDEPYSDDELDDPARTTRADFFAFGNSLTVKDGILTVADDLLKNDGKHFIDMMEQLAERRMQREEDTQYAAASPAHHPMHSGHNHGPPLDEEDYDDEDEEEYDSQEEEEYEEDDMDAMTEEQRMEEGRRMFQIFAARMFEQRVLTAYREKVARERQQKLIEELEEENRMDVEREAKKAREAQKKKDKKKLQKQAKEEEKARREAEKAAEEAAAKALEEKKLEEQRKKKEEQRKKKEAERKAQEEEKARREAERLKRLQEERERQAESERKQREQKDREKKKREETKKKARDERESKEKENRARKAKEEQERKTREEQARKEKDVVAKAEREARERVKRDEQAQQVQQAAHAATQAVKRTSQSGPTHLPPGLQHPQVPSALQSPHLPFATPVVPKAPTPVRPRQASHQGSHASSPRSQQAGTELSQSSISPENVPMSHSSGTSSSASIKGHGQQPILHHPQPSAPMSPLGAAGRGHPSLGFNAIPAPNGIHSNPPGMPGMAPRPPMGHEMPMGAQSGIGGQFRNFASPNSIPMPPGINGNRPMGVSRGFPMEPNHGLPYHAQPPVPISISTHQGHMPREGGRSKAHSRQQSGSFERSPLDPQTQTLPIARPAPIQRPPSAAPSGQSRDEQQKSVNAEVDDLSTQLGSSALLDDTDVPLSSNLSQSLPTAAPGAPGAPGSGRMGFAPPPLFTDPIAISKHPNFPLGAGAQGGTWGSQIPFGSSGFPGASSWGSNPGVGWPTNAFGTIGGAHRQHTSRPVSIRLMVSQACKQLTSNSPMKGSSGYHNVNHVLQKVEQLKSPNEPPIALNEMLDICDTEGNLQNGGGSFSIKNEGARGTFVKFEPDNNSNPHGGRGGIVPGDIGSPVPGSSVPAFSSLGPAGSGPRQFSPQANISPPTGY